MLRKTDLYKGNCPRFLGNRDIERPKYIRYDDLMGPNKRFHHQFHGAPASIAIRMRKYNMPTEFDEKLHHRQMARKLRCGEFRLMKGIDLGRKLLVAGSACAVNGRPYPFALSSKQYHHRAHYNDFERERRRYCRRIDKIYDPLFVQFPINQSTNVTEFITFRLQYFTGKQDVYAQKNVARTRFSSRELASRYWAKQDYATFRRNNMKVVNTCPFVIIFHLLYSVYQIFENIRSTIDRLATTEPMLELVRIAQQLTFEGSYDHRINTWRGDIRIQHE